METVKVFDEYEVYIGSGILKDISRIVKLNKFSKVVVITDEKVPSNFLNSFEKIIVPGDESSKNIETIQYIWKELLRLGCDRKTLIINLGGGVIGDMGGFAASTYMRGVKFLQVPTTLLASVDASVGGKVGIDFSGIKNLIGSFNQPIGVIVDVDTFESLPKREFVSGFGEIIKHGLISDLEYFKKVTSKKPGEFLEDELIEIIKRSCEIKAEIISIDERESGNRKLLNFGHTIGHAIESIYLNTNKPLLHGEAVSLGMIAEAKISQLSGLISIDDLKIIKSVLKNSGLPVNVKIESAQKIIELISKDKKSEKGKINWTLLKGIGNAVINQQVDDSIVKVSLRYISK